MIKNLEARARLPRLGVIRLGIALRGAGAPCGGARDCRMCHRPDGKPGKGHAREVEYFVLPPELRAKLGIPSDRPEDQPRRLQVLFPSDDLRLVLPNDYVRYDGSLITVKCDGETCIEIPKRGKEIVTPCRKEPYGPGKRPVPCPCGATAKARLNLIVVDGPLGIYQVLIGGEQRIADLAVQLGLLKRQLGRLTDFPFWIERVAASSQIRNAQDERIARTGYPVQVKCEFTAAQVLEALRATGDPGVLALTGRLLDHAAEAGEDALSPEERALDEPSRAEDQDPPAPDEAAPPREPEIVEWDISMAYKAAKDLGLDPSVYGRYLDHVYGDRDGLGARELAEQRLMFEKAQTPAAKDQVKRAILHGAQGPPRRPNGQGSLV